MKLKSILVSVLCICIYSVSIQAGDGCGDAKKTPAKDAKTCTDAKAPAKPSADAKAPTTAPAKAPAPELVLPPKLPDVAATVGKETISGEEINEEVAKIRTQMQQRLKSAPPAQQKMGLGIFQQQLNGMPQQMLGSKIFQALLNAYITENKIPCPEDKLNEFKKKIDDDAKKRGSTLEKMMAEQGITEDDLKQAVQSQILQEQTTSKEKVQALVKAHPEYFNGTMVQASHILIPCEGIVSTADQQAAIDKLKKIRADIEAKKITFAEAAAKDSSCPSSSKGGDLGEFTAEKMAPGFSIAAFALKPGEISPVVRTQFGFHIVKLIKRTDGTEKIDPAKLSKETEQQAKGILMSQMYDKIVNLGLTKLPIVINK